MPLFDCLFCCQEHFVLSKICDGIMQMNYSLKMDQRAFELAKAASTLYSDLEDPREALKKLT